MTEPQPRMQVALLPDRGVVRVAGEDAEKLLQGVITGDTELLAQQPAIHAALLTPQGKILFDFFVAKAGDGFLLDTARAKAADLVKRLTLYKLRAKVEIADVSEDYRVLVAWGGTPPGRVETAGSVTFRDPRLPALGLRILTKDKTAANVGATTNATEASADAYHAHRIGLGVPEGGRDYAFGDTFPHEADLDQLGSVSFAKGCFIGQEVVSRMQNRGTARKRILPISGEAPLRSGAEIMAGAATIGTVGSVAGRQALALLRLDRAAEATSKGEPLLADGVAIRLSKPDWATFELSPAARVEAS